MQIMVMHINYIILSAAFIYNMFIIYFLPNIRSCKAICFMKDVDNVEEVWLWLEKIGVMRFPDEDGEKVLSTMIARQHEGDTSCSCPGCQL